MPVGIHAAKFKGAVKDGDSVDLVFIDDQKRTARKRLFKPTGAMLLETTNSAGETVKETPTQALERKQLKNITMADRHSNR